jgi:hypothetical protein
VSYSDEFRYRGKSADQIFRDLVFHANGFRLQHDAVVVKVGPNPFLSTDPQQRDTVAEVQIPRRDVVYRRANTTGRKSFTYSRLQLGDVMPCWDRRFAAPTQDGSTYDILDQINDYFDTCFTVQDLVDVPYQASYFTLILQAKPTSVAWQGQYGSVPQVTDLIPLKKLIGFTPYVNPIPTLSVETVILSGFTPATV